MAIENYQQLRNEIDMLTGCINRMCVTDSFEELEKMYDSAKLRLSKIHTYNETRLCNLKEDE